MFLKANLDYSLIVETDIDQALKATHFTELNATIEAVLNVEVVKKMNMKQIKVELKEEGSEGWWEQGNFGTTATNSIRKGYKTKTQT